MNEVASNPKYPLETESKEGLSREDKLLAMTRELNEVLQQTVPNLAVAGSLLLQAKQLIGHGKFRQWLSENFSMSAKTANRLMSVARLVRHFALDEAAVGRLLDLDLKALYELAAKSTSVSVQSMMLERLAQQREISYELIRDCKLEAQNRPGARGSAKDFSQFVQRLERFCAWLDAQKFQIANRPLRLDERCRRELSACSAKLGEAQHLIESMLAQAEDLRPAAQAARPPEAAN